MAKPFVNSENKLKLGTQVRIKGATYKSGGPIQGMIADYTEKGNFIVEIIGPHVAFYVDSMNLCVSSIVVHPDSIEVM